MKIEEFRITWTADHEQYFQGHGIACTDYTHCATGYGNTLRDALEDALESLAQQSFDIDKDLEAAMLEELESQVEKPELLDMDIVEAYCTDEHTIEYHYDDCPEDCESEACFIEDDDPDCSVCAGEWHYYVMVDLKVGD